MSSLRENVASTISYSLVDFGLNKVIKLIIEIVVINLLTKDDIGIWGIAMSYLVFINYVSFAPENILIREYANLKHDRALVNRLFSSYIIFTVAKGLAITAIVSITVALIASFNLVLGLAFLFLTLKTILLQATEIFRLYFYVEFKQKVITAINLFENILIGVSLVILYVSPTILTYILLLFVVQSIVLLIWVRLFYSQKEFSFSYYKSWFKDIISNFKEFTLWQHLNGTSTKVIYEIDPLILGLFATLATVGDYTIALKVSNYFFLLPMLLQKSTLLHFSNKKREATSVLIKYGGLYFLLAIGQLLFFMLVGHRLIYELYDKDNTDEVFLLALFIIVGITILNTARPLIAYAGSKLSVRRAFFRVYLPSTVFALITYFILVSEYSARGLAVGNIINYSFFMILLVLFFITEKNGNAQISS